MHGDLTRQIARIRTLMISLNLSIKQLMLVFLTMTYILTADYNFHLSHKHLTSIPQYNTEQQHRTQHRNRCHNNVSRG